MQFSLFLMPHYWRKRKENKRLLDCLLLTQDSCFELASLSYAGMSRLCKYAADFIISIDDWENGVDTLKIDFLLVFQRVYRIYHGHLNKAKTWLSFSKTRLKITVACEILTIVFGKPDTFFHPTLLSEKVIHWGWSYRNILLHKFLLDHTAFTTEKQYYVYMTHERFYELPQASSHWSEPWPTGDVLTFSFFEAPTQLVQMLLESVHNVCKQTKHCEVISLINLCHHNP